MSAQSNSAEPVQPDGGTGARRPKTGGDWVIPVIAFAFATYYLISIRDLVWEAKIAAVFVAVVLYALIGIFAFKTVFGLLRGRLSLDFSNLWETPELFRIRGLLFGLAVLSVAILPWVGFTTSTFLFLLASFLWLEKMPAKMAFITAGALAVAGYILFIAILGTAFPLGPFELAVRALTGI